VCLSNSLFGQYNFDDYKTLQSQGAMPEDFSLVTYQKIEKRLESKDSLLKNDIDQRFFLGKSMYSIDELLHSGFVSYGDEMTMHIQAVADLLLKNNPELKSQLRFYTLKTAQTNAFSTDQGIIFVTTGLVSQINNDAQLAYVLAHEIAHFTEKHAVNTYNWSKQKDNITDKIAHMSQYSRENEFEADKLAVELYKNAGFLKEEIPNVFDVLLYSYLPFDELEITLDYFQSAGLVLPSYLFPSTEFPIKASEDIDDSKSTHPNIKKRRVAVAEKIASLGNEWGTMAFISGSAKFLEVRTIARFESLRIQVVDAEYAKGLYSIFILEKEYPNSIYLKRLKSQCWLGLYQYIKILKLGQTVAKNNEGESVKVHYLLSKMDKKALVVLALRNVYQLKTEQPEDAELNAIYKQFCKELGSDKSFNIKKFFTVKSELMVSDSLNPIDTAVIKRELNKYDKIKKEINGSNDASNQESENYYLYGLIEILKDPEFKSYYQKSNDEYLKELQEIKDLESLSDSERKKYTKKHDKDDLKLGISNLIIMEPRVISYTKQGIDEMRSEYLEKTFQEAYTIASEAVGNNIQIISSQQFELGGTAVYNQRNALKTRMHQMLNNDNIQSFPVDYSLTSELVKQTNTTKVLFSMVEHTYSPDFKNGLLLTSLLFPIIAPFVLPVHVPFNLMTGNNTNITLVLLDIETGEILYDYTNYFSAPLNKHNLSAYLYMIFKHFGTVPTN
jgi:hypothetical protein